MIPLLIVLIAGLLFALGLWAGIRHQLRHSQDHPARVATPAQDLQPIVEARALAASFTFVPGRVVDVTEQELRDNPVRWHGQTIRVTSTWGRGFEYSNIAGVWARVASGEPPPEGRHEVTAEGLWLYPRAPTDAERPGFGHMGLSWGEFIVARYAARRAPGQPDDG